MSTSESKKSGGRRPSGPRPLEPARRLALEAVSRVRHGAFLAPTLHGLLAASGLEREDRALATDLTYGVVRRLPQLDAALAPLLKRPDRLPPAVLDALRLGAYEVIHRGTPAYAAVHAWVAVTKAVAPALSGVVNAVLRRVAPLDATADPALAAALPAWLYGELEAALGAEAKAAAAAMLEPEPLWLTAFGPEAEALLADDGVTFAPVSVTWRAAPGLPRALRVRSPLPLDQLRAFKAGAVQPQNPASLAAALLVEAEPGDLVLDLASGRGVKSAALAAMGARVTAVELDARRAAAAEANLRRLGLGATHVTADLLRPLDLPQATHVLLDAPCTGTGTLRGHPEIKLRLTPEGVAAAAGAQAHMLATAAAVTAPGGALVYAVCSLTATEGPDTVGRFLLEHPDFSAEPIALPLATLAAGPGAFVLPLDGLDGFYLARLRRRP